MAYTRKRPTGGCGVSMFNKATKDTFEDAVKSRGFTYSVEREHVGEWNEGRRFVVNGQGVEFCFKGERPNWEAMVRTVEGMES